MNGVNKMDKINKKFFHVNELKKGMMNCKDNEKKKKLIIDLTHQIISSSILNYLHKI